MKKIISILIGFLAVGLFSCSEFEPGGTATQSLSGDWYVKVYLQDTTGVWEDQTDGYAYAPVDGYTYLTTYNTALNSPYEMFIDDHKTFWWASATKVGYKAKIGCNAHNMTFGVESDTVQNLIYDSHMIISGGKVLKNAAKSPSGVTTDSIVFYIRFNDDSTPYGYVYKVAGFRKTGYLEDNIF